MDDTWVKIVAIIASVLSGGVAGAVITLFVKKYQDRIQPVRYRVKVERVFNQIGKDDQLHAELIVQHDRESYHYTNLFLVELMLVNSGNQDRATFSMGIQFNKVGVRAIRVETGTQDRHHVVKFDTLVSPASPQTEVDFILQPFHRENVYTMTFYVNIPEGMEDIDTDILEPTSSESVRFVGLSGLTFATEVMSDALAEVLSMALPIPMKVTAMRAIVRLINGVTKRY